VPPGSGVDLFRAAGRIGLGAWRMCGVAAVFHISTEMCPGRSGLVRTAGARPSSMTMALPFWSWPVDDAADFSVHVYSLRR